MFSGKHACTEADKCLGFEYCQRLDLHPDEKKRQREEKKVEKERAKRQKKEEYAAHKAERDALLRLPPAPNWDTWHVEEGERLAAAHPDKYSLSTGGTRMRAETLAELAKRFSRARQAYKRSKAIVDKLTAELEVLAPRLSHEELMAFIRRRKEELENDAERLVAEDEKREAEERMAQGEDEEDEEEEDDDQY
jgi:hypothetical protein